MSCVGVTPPGLVRASCASRRVAPVQPPAGVVYVCVCFGLSLRVHSGPADHAVRPNPRAGGCNRRSRGLPAVTLPILCTLAPIYVLRFERRFGLSKVVRQSCSPDPCTSPAITFRISVFAHFVYTCPMPFLFIISMSWVSRLGLRQVYTKWAIRRRPRCPPGVP